MASTQPITWVLQAAFVRPPAILCLDARCGILPTSQASDNPHYGDPTKVPPNLVNFTPRAYSERAMTPCEPAKNGNSYEEANELFTVRRDASKRGARRKRAANGTATRLLITNERQQAGDTDPSHLFRILSSA